MSVRAFRNFRGFPSLCCTPCTSPSRYSSTSEIFQLFSHKTRNRFQVLDTTAMTFYGCQGICCWGNRQRFVNNQPVLAPPPGTSFHPIHALHGRLNDSTDFAQARLTLQDTPAAAMHRYTAGTPCPAPSNASYPSSGYMITDMPSRITRQATWRTARQQISSSRPRYNQGHAL